MSSKRRLSQNLSLSGNKLRLDSINKILKIDSSRVKKSKRELLAKQISQIALADLIKDTPAKSSLDLPDFKNFLLNKDNIRLFREFLKTQYCQENIDFYLACERYKKLDPDKVGKELVKFIATQIYNDHLCRNARHPVNINHTCLQDIIKHMKDPQPDLLSDAQAEIFNLMKSDCYPRFCKTWRLDIETARRILCEQNIQNTPLSITSETTRSDSIKNGADTTLTSLMSTTSTTNTNLQSGYNSSLLQSRGIKRKLTLPSSISNGCPSDCIYFRVGLPCQQHPKEPENLVEQSGTSDLIDKIDLSRLHKVPNCCRRRTPPPPPLPPKPNVIALGSPTVTKKMRPYIGKAFDV